jgi:hypothetical protein
LPPAPKREKSEVWAQIRFIRFLRTFEEQPWIYRFMANGNSTYTDTAAAEDRATLGSDPSAAAGPYGTGGIQSGCRLLFAVPEAQCAKSMSLLLLRLLEKVRKNRMNHPSFFDKNRHGMTRVFS